MLFQMESYTARIEAPTKLKTCGVQIPSLPIDLINGSDLKGYCLYIAEMRRNGCLTNSERNRCIELSRILKSDIKMMKNNLMEMEIENGPKTYRISPKELYYQILGLLRAVECLEAKEFKPFIKSKSVAKKINDTKQELKFLKDTGALTK